MNAPANPELMDCPATWQPGDADYVTRAMKGAIISPSNYAIIRGLKAIAATGVIGEWDAYNATVAALADIMAYCEFDCIDIEQALTDARKMFRAEHAMRTEFGQ